MLGSDARFRVTNRTRSTVLAERSRKATNFVTRGVGLMGQRNLAPDEGLIIQPCNSVVSFFMRFPIDVLFVDKDGAILHLMRPMVPWRTSRIVRGSRFVVELPAGAIAGARTETGDIIEISPA